jgi:hypothetical protein
VAGVSNDYSNTGYSYRQVDVNFLHEESAHENWPFEKRYADKLYIIIKIVPQQRT